MSDTHISRSQHHGSGCPPLHSTYVRTIVCINNTYIHTYLSKPKPPEFAELAIREINAYCNHLSRGEVDG